MAENIEFDPHDTQEVLETVERDLEREIKRERPPRWVGFVALSTALLSVVAAISALQAASYSNEALALSNSSVLFQAQASDQWAYYQAKGIKHEVRAAGADLLTTMAGPAAQIATYKAEADRAHAEQSAIATKATELEKQSTDVRAEANNLQAIHHRFAYAVALFQVAIALCSVAALTRQRLAWFGGILTGTVGLLLFGSGFLA